ncbi:hypothetical protein BRAO375_600048 [Bradyrhizobium sp. ORS 375]|nr:hypothetical protein BRAO375_600048 [Bradyrhizobium sp. ORS 375]
MSWDKLSIEFGKHLNHIGLAPEPSGDAGLLKDVNKRLAICGRHCMSPIHRYLDSNPKILKLFGLEAIEPADMSRLPMVTSRLRDRDIRCTSGSRRCTSLPSSRGWPACSICPACSSIIARRRSARSSPRPSRSWSVAC